MATYSLQYNLFIYIVLSPYKQQIRFYMTLQAIFVLARKSMWFVCKWYSFYSLPYQNVNYYKYTV